MKILICYHSTTGNTKTVTLYTRTLFQSLGHQCEVVDITRAPSSELSMEDWDLVGFASPTLYFRGTFTMERFITNLPPVSGPARPAFLLATCAGEPGAQFHLQAETLHHKGYVVTGAHAVIAPSNWPMQLALTDKITWSEPLGRTITRIFRPSRLLLSALWPALGTPDQKDKSSLDRFVESLASQSIDTPQAARLPSGLPGGVLSGKAMTREKAQKAAGIRIDAATCIGCGICEKICPESAVSRPHGADKPVVGSACTGCFTCYHRCPCGAIFSASTRNGAGRYPGPSSAFTALFS